MEFALSKTQPWRVLLSNVYLYRLMAQWVLMRTCPRGEAPVNLYASPVIPRWIPSAQIMAFLGREHDIPHGQP